MMNSNLIGKIDLADHFYKFKSFVEMRSGCLFDGFDNNYFLKKEEGYKYKVFKDAQKYLQLDSWDESKIGTGCIAECFKKAYDCKGNLFNYHGSNRTKKKIDDNLLTAEKVLYNIYLGNDDEKAFAEAVEFFGAKYDLIAYLFFIKDRDEYLPISPKNFERMFAVLGINVKLQYQCSWENYAEYLSLIRQIKEKMEEYFSLKVSLLDAHSFVRWIEEAEKHFITKEKWIELLKNEAVFTIEDKNILKEFYISPGHTAACSELEDRTGKSLIKINKSMGSVGKKISEMYGFAPIITRVEEKRHWPILFRGIDRDDNKFDWKIKPELTEALEEVFPEEKSKHIEKETEEFIAETETQREISTSKILSKSEFFGFIGKPRMKPELIETKHGKGYRRDKQRSLNALHRANFLCECSAEHKTFLRKNSNINYTEPHHLVPMAYQDRFDSTLDTESNIVSLCSNCHNQIHYGQGYREIIMLLYEQRKEALKKEGIDITLEGLLEMYD